MAVYRGMGIRVGIGNENKQKKKKTYKSKVGTLWKIVNVVYYEGKSMMNSSLYS